MPTEAEYQPKHMKAKPGELSRQGREAMNALRLSDPWSAEAINRAVQRYKDIAAEMLGGPTDCDETDMFNYLAAEVNALMIILLDQGPTIPDLLESFKWQLEVLLGE